MTQSLGQTVKVTTSKVNVRSGPGTEYKVIERVKKGEPLDIVEKKGDWLRIRRQGGREGWIHAKLVKATSPSTIRVNEDKENLQKTPGKWEEPKAGKPKNSGTKVKNHRGFVHRKVKLSESMGMVKVIGEMTNHSRKDYMAVGFIISFFDARQRPLGTGNILIEDFLKGETKSFRAYVEDVNYHRIHRYYIKFDFEI
jgi:uncharacterized protein YgiM (DUF1202 family)